MSGGAGFQIVRGRAPASVSGTVVRDGAQAAASHMYPFAGAARCSRTLLRTPSRSGTREGRGAPMRGFSHTNVVTEVPA